MDILFCDNSKQVPYYYHDAIRCAQHFNPHSAVTHVGFDRAEEDRFIDASPLKPLCDEVLKGAKYGGPNSWFRRGDIDRYVWIAQLIEKGAVHVPLITCDWDVLLVRPIHEILYLWSEFDYTLAEGMSGGEMLIFHRGFPAAFVEFLRDIYQRDKYPKIKAAQINDMSLLTAFRDTHPEFKVGETNEVRGGSLFDSNVRLHHETYEFDGPHKKLYFGNEMVRVKKIKTGEMVRLNNIHCWLEKDNMKTWTDQAIKS